MYKNNFHKPQNYSNKGQAFEEIICLVNLRYEREKTAVIRKIPTAWKPIRGENGKICSAKVEEKAAVDFLGLGLGRAIAFDAKHTDNDRSIAWSRLEPHQEDLLRQWNACGGIAFVLIEWQIKKIFVIPIELWGGNGEKSMPLAQIGKHLEVPTRGGLPDYLETVRQIWGN